MDMRSAILHPIQIASREPQFLLGRLGRRYHRASVRQYNPHPSFGNVLLYFDEPGYHRRLLRLACHCNPCNNLRSLRNLANKYSNSNYSAKLNQHDMCLIQYQHRRQLLGLCNNHINNLTSRHTTHVDYQHCRHLKLKYYSNLFEYLHLYLYKLYNIRNTG
jgi:hypothetical protein